MQGGIIELLKNNRKYIFYGSSILISRGLEYLILLFAPLYLSKQDYGDLEYYKKLIEFASTVLGFGLPTLMITYSKSKDSKVYLLLFSVVVIFSIAFLTIPFLYFFEHLYLLFPILFYALFFNNGILQNYFLVAKGSNAASIFKTVISFVFYGSVCVYIYYSKTPSYAFIEPVYILFFIGAIFLFRMLMLLKVKYAIFIKYLKVFKKLLLSSSTLVVSTFANMMFMYSDVFIIKLLSQNSSIEIANYSFVLNITNVVILVPMTLVQVDIEKIKTDSYLNLKKYRLKTATYIFVFSLLIIFTYLFLINTYYQLYKETLILFAILIFGKFIQANSVYLGTQILIKKFFIENLKINIITVTFNVIASYLCYLYMGLTGIAFISTVSLLMRYFVLNFYYKKTYSK